MKSDHNFMAQVVKWETRAILLKVVALILESQSCVIFETTNDHREEIDGFILAHDKEKVWTTKIF